MPFSLFHLSFQVVNSPIDGGDQFMVPLALGPSLFRSQHGGELGQHVALFLPNEHGLFCTHPRAVLNVGLSAPAFFLARRGQHSGIRRQGTEATSSHRSRNSHFICDHQYESWL